MSRVLSRDNVPLKVPYLLAHTSELMALPSWPYPHDSYGLMTHMALPSWLVVPMGGRCFKCPRPSPTLGSLGPISPMAPQVPGVTPGSPLRPWCWGHSLWRGARHASSLWVMFLNIVWLLVVSWGRCVWRCVWLQVFCLGLVENHSVVYVAPFVN
jgi:hypothetical protein